MLNISSPCLACSKADFSYYFQILFYQQLSAKTAWQAWVCCVAWQKEKSFPIHDKRISIFITLKLRVQDVSAQSRDCVFSAVKFNPLNNSTLQRRCLLARVNYKKADPAPKRNGNNFHLKLQEDLEYIMIELHLLEILIWYIIFYVTTSTSTSTSTVNVDFIFLYLMLLLVAAAPYSPSETNPQSGLRLISGSGSQLSRAMPAM